jgi:quercetin dioxygenase-like cupin family protein
MTSNQFVTSKTNSQEKQFEGVYRRTMATTQQLMFCEFFLERGAEVPTHKHIHDQVGYVVYGSIKLQIGDEEKIVVQGDSYAIIGDTPHSGIAQEDTLLIEGFTPPREEYLR